MIKNVTILGAGESGFGAAMLASKKGFNVFVSDFNYIDDNIKLLFEDHSIKYEENKHSIDKIQSSDLIIKSPGIPNSSDIIIKIKSLKIPNNL
jgi:UDP-N-acetylmuramoylalanine-D-glutamate ligase